ncbi:hypothetical protein [Klebsiella pneumoniae IS53]|nr:hypothetical protein [Klebsiella pneumoniae IS53]
MPFCYPSAPRQNINFINIFYNFTLMKSFLLPFIPGFSSGVKGSGKHYFY